MIYTITTNPSLDYTVDAELIPGQINRTSSEVIYILAGQGKVLYEVGRGSTSPFLYSGWGRRPELWGLRRDASGRPSGT